MIRLFVVLTLAMLGASAALAQESRLDTIQKAGALRVCTPGDYKPFSLAKTDTSFEGLDVDIAQAMAKSLGVEAKFVKTSWPKLMDDFVEKCDLAAGQLRLRPLMTHLVSYRRGPEMYHLHAEKSSNFLGLTLDWSEA